MTSAIVAVAIAVAIQAEPKYKVADNQQFVITPAVIQYSPAPRSSTENKNMIRVIETTNTYIETGDTPRFCTGEIK